MTYPACDWPCENVWLSCHRYRFAAATILGNSENFSIKWSPTLAHLCYSPVSGQSPCWCQHLERSIAQGLLLMHGLARQRPAEVSGDQESQTQICAGCSASGKQAVLKSANSSWSFLHLHLLFLAVYLQLLCEVPNGGWCTQGMISKQDHQYGPSLFKSKLPAAFCNLAAGNIHWTSFCIGVNCLLSGDAVHVRGESRLFHSLQRDGKACGP